MRLELPPDFSINKCRYKIGDDISNIDIIISYAEAFEKMDGNITIQNEPFPQIIPATKKPMKNPMKLELPKNFINK